MKRSRREATAWILAAVLYAAAPAGAITLNSSFETGDASDWTTVGDVSVVGSGFGVTPTDGSFQILLTTDTGAVDVATTETAMGLTAGTLQDIFVRRFLDRTPPRSTGSGPTDGSAIQQSFYAEAGDVLMFDWNFLTDENVREPEYTDFLWVHLQQPNNNPRDPVLGHANQRTSNFSSSASSFDLERGYQTREFNLGQTGTYTLTLGVHDVQDTWVPSGAIFDNFRLIRGPEPNTFLLVASGLLGLNWHARRRKTQRAST